MHLCMSHFLLVFYKERTQRTGRTLNPPSIMKIHCHGLKRAAYDCFSCLIIGNNTAKAMNQCRGWGGGALTSKATAIYTDTFESGTSVLFSMLVSIIISFLFFLSQYKKSVDCHVCVSNLPDDDMDECVSDVQEQFEQWKLLWRWHILELSNKIKLFSLCHLIIISY